MSSKFFSFAELCLVLAICPTPIGSPLIQPFKYTNDMNLHAGQYNDSLAKKTMADPSIARRIQDVIFSESFQPLLVSWCISLVAFGVLLSVVPLRCAGDSGGRKMRIQKARHTYRIWTSFLFVMTFYELITGSGIETTTREDSRQYRLNIVADFFAQPQRGYIRLWIYNASNSCQRQVYRFCTPAVLVAIAYLLHLTWMKFAKWMKGIYALRRLTLGSKGGIG